MTFESRRVLVTGAGGSIGSEICRSVCRDRAERLVLVSLTESGLYDINRRLRAEFGPDPATVIVPVLGSAGDAELMRRHMTGVDIVVHAGAHKHVPLCEQNPSTAVLNNVGVSYRLAAYAQERKVGQFCFVSSDKAVRPASVMGATKRLVEMIIQALPAQPTKFCTVRFGNVLDSAGSVLPLWREQIAAGGPVTLTDARCERYFMSIPEAVTLIRETLGLEQTGTFVFDMGKPRRLIELARELIDASGRAIVIELSGLRPGEKLTEELHHGGNVTPTSVSRVLRVEEREPAVVDEKKLQALAIAAARFDDAEAVRLLWELVR